MHVCERTGYWLVVKQSDRGGTVGNAKVNGLLFADAAAGSPWGAVGGPGDGPGCAVLEAISSLPFNVRISRKL